MTNKEKPSGEKIRELVGDMVAHLKAGNIIIADKHGEDFCITFKDTEEELRNKGNDQ